MEDDEDICTVLLDETIELERHELEDLETLYVSDTEMLDVPDSCEYLRSEITDHSIMKDIVLDSDEEEATIGGCGSSSSKKMKETSDKWKPNTLVYRRRRRKNVGGGEHFIQSSVSARQTTTEEHCEAEKQCPVSYYAPDMGNFKFEGEKLHYPNKIVDKDSGNSECSEKLRRNLAVIVADADEFPSSYSEKTKHGGNDVSPLICPNGLEIVSTDDCHEPGEPFNMNALDFVDHFLAVNNLNIAENQKIDGGKVGLMKSLPPFNAKGVQTLARKTYLAGKPRELTVFDWDEKEITEWHSGKILDEEFDGNETDKEDTFDFGFDTQMAAEAMEALIFAPPPPDIAAQYAHEVPKKSKESLSGTNLMIPGPVSEISQEQLENISITSINSNCDISCPLKTHSGYTKECKSQLLSKNSVICREPLAAKSLNCRKPLIVKKVSRGRNLRLTGQLQADENSELESSEGVGGNCSSSKSTHCQQPRDRIVQKFMKSSSVTMRNTRKPSQRFSEVSKDSMCTSKRSMCNTLELDVPKKKRMSISSEVNFRRTSERKLLNSSSHRLLGIMSSKKTQQGRSYSGSFGTSSPLTLDPLCCTKQKRTHKGVPRNQYGKLDTIDPIENVKVDLAPANNDASETSKINEGYKGPRKKLHASSSLLKELARLGYAESLPNFTPRELRKRRNDNISVLFSQHLGSNILNRQKKIIARLGFSVASCCSDATHFVTDRFVRTRNMLEAISLGKPVLTHYWLESCEQAHCCVNEKFYILRDAEKEKEIGFSMPVTLACASKHPLLMGRRVFITPNVKPGIELIQSLVKLVQGKVVKRIPNNEWKDGCMPNDLLILSSEEDYATCMPLLDKGASIYDSELLLNGIVLQKLEFERHQLFKNQSNCSSKRPRKSEKSRT